jgi:hypothetical protein
MIGSIAAAISAFVPFESVRSCRSRTSGGRGARRGGDPRAKVVGVHPEVVRDRGCEGLLVLRDVRALVRRERRRSRPRRLGGDRDRRLGYRSDRRRRAHGAGSWPWDLFIASGLFNTSLQIGGALGRAVLSTLATSRAQAARHVARIEERAPRASARSSRPETDEV